MPWILLLLYSTQYPHNCIGIGIFFFAGRRCVNLAVVSNKGREERFAVSLQNRKNYVWIKYLTLVQPLKLIAMNFTVFLSPQKMFFSCLWRHGAYLTHFSLVSHFYTHWKRQKTKGFLTFSTKGFLTFSGGTEMWHWTKMG